MVCHMTTHRECELLHFLDNRGRMSRERLIATIPGGYPCFSIMQLLRIKGAECLRE